MLREYAEAEPLYRRALGIMEKALGPTHPNIAGSLENLARLLRATNGEAEAAEMEARARKIREPQAQQALAAQIADLTKAIEANPQDAEAYANRGLARSWQGDRRGAREDLNKALELEADPGRQAWIKGTLESLGD